MGVLGTLSGESGGFETGTKVIFQQSSAPTGWTKDTTHDNKAMRVVSGSVSSGGNDPFTTTFGSGKSTSSHTLSSNQMPSHSHNSGLRVKYGNSGPLAATTGGNQGNIGTGSAGGSGSHSHSLSGFNLQYVDVIVATKD